MLTIGTTTLPMLLLFPLVFSMQTFDMCATFQRSLSESSVTLVTPGYLQNVNYRNNSVCECTLESSIPVGQPRSLNITVQDMDLEYCYDKLTISAVYTFEIYLKDFVLCGETLPISDKVPLASATGRYGHLNTIYSLDMLKLRFNTDGDVTRKGAKLLIRSHNGISVRCHGDSGPLEVTTQVPVFTTAPSTTRYNNRRSDRRKKDEEKDPTVVIGAVIGCIMVLFVSGLAAGVFLLIRKHRKPPISRLRNTENGVSGERRPSDAPIYRDINAGRPDLPIPGSANMQCTDHYLYMSRDPTTPVYASPQPIIYTNQDVPASHMVQEEQYQDGYIIPGTVISSVGEEAPLMQQIARAPNKPPIPQPKKSKVLIPPFRNRKPRKNNTDNSNQPSPADTHLLDNNAAAASSSSSANQSNNDLVYEPALVKPSDMKNKVKFSPSNANIRSGAKPEIKAKPKLKFPPKKSTSVTGEDGDTFQKVGVQTTQEP